MEAGLTRREMLKLGLAGGAALMLPLERLARTRLAADRLAESALPRPFQVPLTTPPVLSPVCTNATTDFYEIRQRAAQVEIVPGLRTTIFGYNGIMPGPTIKVRTGRQVVVRQINELPATHPTLGYPCTTSTHLHGNASLPEYDGWANDLTPPGFYKDYRYPNDQNERCLWYHDHAWHHTAENVYMGLAAFYITDEGRDLPLPRGRYDVPLLLGDKIIAQDGSLIFDDSSHAGLFGDVLLVNGRPSPVMQVERRKYYFRFLNGGPSRAYKLALSTGQPFTFVSNDGGLMPVPQRATSFRLGVAERYGVVIDFAQNRIGDQVVLRNLPVPSVPDFPSTRQVMRFDVVSEPTDTSNNEVPSTLNPGNHPYNPMKLTAADAVRTRDFRFVRKNGLWTINGRTWDPNRADANPGLDDVEIWRLINNSGGWNHPVHIHLIDFKILDRNGRPPFPYERGPKDVTYVGENETVRVIGRYGPRTGRYMMHCHNVVHEDHDMMTHFMVGGDARDPAQLDSARPLPAGPLCS